MKHILFLISTPLPASESQSWHTFGNYIFDWAKNTGVDTSFMSFSEMLFQLDEDGKTRIYSPFSGVDVAEADFVIFRTIRDHNEQAEEVALFLNRHNIPYVDERIHPRAHGKYSWQVRYAEDGLPFIPTSCGTGRTLLKAYETGMVSTEFPFVIKARQGRQGKDNFLIRTGGELTDLLKTRPDDYWVIQPYIDNDGDYRLVVLGDKVELALLRKRRKDSDTHLNNTSQGAEATRVEPESLPRQLLDDAVSAARLTGLSVAGVDMMISATTGRHVILEVNGAPQLSSGAFPDEKMRGYTDYLTRLIDNIKSKS